MEIYYENKEFGSFSHEREDQFLTFCKLKGISYLPLEEKGYTVFPPLIGITVALCTLQKRQNHEKVSTVILKEVEEYLIRQGALVLNVTDQLSFGRLLEFMNVQLLFSIKEREAPGADSRVRFYSSLKRSQESLKMIRQMIKILAKNNAARRYEIPRIGDYLFHWKDHSLFFSPVPTVLLDICNTKLETEQLQEAIYQALIEGSEVKAKEQQRELITELLNFLEGENGLMLMKEENTEKEKLITPKEQETFREKADPTEEPLKEEYEEPLKEEYEKIDLEGLEYLLAIEEVDEAKEQSEAEKHLPVQEKKRQDNFEVVPTINPGENQEEGINFDNNKKSLGKVVGERTMVRKKRGGTAALYPPPEGQVFQFSAPIKEGDGFPFLPPHQEGDHFFSFKVYYPEKGKKEKNTSPKEYPEGAELQKVVNSSKLPNETKLFNDAKKERHPTLPESAVNLLEEIKKIDAMD